MRKVTKFELEFLKKEKVTSDTYSFYFNRKGIDFDFKPGQYIKIYLLVSNPDERGTSRYFTISSSPTDKDFLTITTRIVRSSFKLTLNKMKPGEKVNIFGPLGYFDFDEKSKKQNVFLSGGMGITPFHCILRYVNFKRLNPNIILIASFSLKDEAIFYDELSNIELANSTIKTVYTLTKEDKYYPELEKGRIDSNVIKKYVQNYEESKFFIVGPEAFEISMIETIRKMGVSEDQIFSENFPGY